MPTFKLKVSPAALDLGQTVLRAIFAIKRASVVDSFVIVPDLKRDVVVVDNEDFEVSLLPNTPGSVYEVVMFGARTELMRAFFLMPASDVFLHELNLLTAYPEMNPVVASFLNLVDTPNSYVGHAGKLVAVKQDETGLEFIDDEPPLISCVGAIDTATMVTVFSPNATVEITGFTMDVNGKRRTFNILENSDPVEWLTYEFPEVEFTGPFGETINNRGSENLRVMYRYEPANQDAALSIEFTDNVTGGSSVDNPDGFATVCLAPVDETNFCAGATDSITLGTCTGGGILKYFVNGVEVGGGLGRNIYGGSLEPHGLKVTPILPDGSIDTNGPWYSNTAYQRFENLTEDVIRVRVETVDANVINKQMAPNNPTVVFTDSMGVSTAEFCLTPISCPDGYKRTVFIDTSVGIDPDITEIQNGDTVYIPIALTQDGPSITQPFVVNADLTDADPSMYWYRIGRYIAEQLADQLAPHGLNAVWTNNNHEFGVTDPADTLEQATKFYILDDGNTYPEEQMPRGLVPVYCQIAT